MTKALEILQDKSIVIAMEELSELIQSLSKMLRGLDNVENVSEELADVIICIQWIKEYYNISDKDIQIWYDIKQKRIEDRITRGILY